MNLPTFPMVRRKLLFFGSITALLTAVVWASSTTPTTADTQAYPFLFAPDSSPSNISFSSATVADLDCNGDLEILTADANGRVWAWDHNGNILSGYPMSTNSFSERIDGPLAVANLSGDCNMEIVAGSRGKDGNAPGERGRVWVWPWNSPGSWLSGWPQEMEWEYPGGSKRAEVYTVALGNVTGDSTYEIMAGTSNQGGDSSATIARNVHAWTANGSALSGYPTGYRTAGIWGFLAVTNITGNGYAEVLTGRDHVYAHAYDSSGNDLPNFPLRTTYDEADTNYDTDSDPDNDWGTFPYYVHTRSAPTVGDIDLDGTQEIVLAGKYFNSSHQNVGSGLIVFEPDGDRQPGWELGKVAGPALSSNFRPKQAASLADLTGDGRLEIIVPYYDGTIRAYRHDGTELWSYDYAQGSTLFASEAVIGDINGDTLVEIVFGTYNPDSSDREDVRLHALTISGNPVVNFPLELPNENNNAKSGIRGAPTIADVDRDCDVEILVASRRGVLYVWDLPGAYYWDKMPWPSARHDNLRSGSYNGPTYASSCPASIPLDPQAYLPLVGRN